MNSDLRAQTSVRSTNPGGWAGLQGCRGWSQTDCGEGEGEEGRRKGKVEGR